MEPSKFSSNGLIMFAGRTADDLNRILRTLLHPGASLEDKQDAMRHFIGVAPDAEEVEEDDGAGVGIGDAGAARAVDTICPTTIFALPVAPDEAVRLQGDLSTLLFCLALVTGRRDIQALYQYLEQRYPHYHDAAQRQRMLGHAATMYQEAHGAFDADDPATVRQLQTAQHILQSLLANPAFVTAATSAPTAERQALLRVATQMCQGARRDFDARRPEMVTRLANAENLLAMLMNNPAFVAASVTLPEANRYDILRETVNRYTRALSTFNPANLSTAMQLQRAQESLQTVLSHEALLQTVTNPAPAVAAGRADRPTLIELLTPAGRLTPDQQAAHARTIANLFGQFVAAEVNATATVKSATNQHHQAQRDWGVKVAGLAHPDAPSAEEIASFEATQRRLEELAATQGRAITGYQHATASLATSPTLQVADCSYYGTPVLALAGGDPDGNELSVRLTRIATQQLFARRGWADPTSNKPREIDDATAATRAYGFRCMRLLETQATAIGHRANLMYPLLATMAGELVSDEDLTAPADDAAETVKAAVDRALNLAYPNGSRLAARSEDGLNAIELFWHRELNLLAAVATKLLTSKRAMLVAQAAAAVAADADVDGAEPVIDATAETAKTNYLAACAQIIDWEPHRSPLDTLKRQLTAETWAERAILRLIQAHEAPGAFSDARAAQATPRANATGAVTRNTLAFFAQMALVDLATSGELTLIGTAMLALLLLGSAATVPVDAQPEALLVRTANSAVRWQLTQASIAWGITAAERFAGGTFLSPQTLQRWVVPGASLVLRLGSITMGGLAVRNTAQALGRLPVTLRGSDATTLRFGMIGDAAGQLLPVIVSPVINGLMRAAADPAYASTMTLGDLIVPEWRFLGATPPMSLISQKAPEGLRCVDTAETGISIGGISFSVVARHGNFPFGNGAWAPTCKVLAADNCNAQAVSAYRQLAALRTEAYTYMKSRGFTSTSGPSAYAEVIAYLSPEARQLREMLEYAESPYCLGVMVPESCKAMATEASSSLGRLLHQRIVAPAYTFSPTWIPRTLKDNPVTLPDMRLISDEIADSSTTGQRLVKTIQAAVGDKCVATTTARLLRSGEDHASIHFVVSGAWTPHDPYDVAPSAPNYPVGWAPKAWGVAAFQSPSLQDRPAALAGPTGLESRAVLAYADLGILPGVHPATTAASMPAQAGAYGSALTAMRLPVMIGAGLASQGFHETFCPSIVSGGEFSRLHTMATSLLANTQPDAAGRAATTSAPLNELFNQGMQVTQPGAAASRSVTLLALYHQATAANQQVTRSETIHALVTGFKTQLTQAMVNCFHLTEADEAALTVGREANPAAYDMAKRKTNAAGRFIDRLITLKADIAAGRESRDSLAENTLIRTFCASRTAEQLREQLEALMLSGTVGTPAFATDTSDAALVVKEYFNTIARTDYRATPEETTLLRIRLQVNQRYGAPEHLAMATENPYAAGAPTATSIPTGLTALAISWWESSGLESLAARRLDTPTAGPA